MKRPWLIALWLLALAAYILLGVPAATFHGDEAMQVYMSSDYYTAFIDRQPERLLVSSPYQIDDDPWLRILNGSVNRYAIGLSWQLAGEPRSALPPRPGWDWGLDYETNVQTGHRPTDRQLLVSRLSSALFLAAGLPLIFALGQMLAGPLAAYLASGLYALHPVLLLNGRRAMQEGSFLCFGLLALLAAAHIARARAEGRAPHRLWWLALILGGGLALASKHSAIILVAGAFAWLAAAELLRLAAAVGAPRWVARFFITPHPSPITPHALLSPLLALIATLSLFFALSPALWNDPAARFRDLIEQRQFLLDIQVAVDPEAPMTLARRAELILTQPFLTPPAHFEVAFWAGVPAVEAEIARYNASPWFGLPATPWLTVPLTLLMLVGLLWLLAARGWRWGLLAWLLVTIGALLVNPLPWQRYYLPLLPIAILLAACGVAALLRRANLPLVRFRTSPHTKA